MAESHDQGDSSLRQRAIRGTLWFGSARALTQVITWMATLLVVRVLSPSDYGLFGFATLVTGIADLVAELGLGAAIVQKRDLDRDGLDTIFWTSMATGTVIYALTWLLAPAIAQFFRQDRLTAVLRVAMLAFIVGSARVIPWNLLTKQIDFARRSSAEAAAAVLSSGATLLLAWRGWGVWSLVAGLLCRSIVLTVLCFWFMPWRPRWRYSTTHLGGIIRFGAEVAGGRISWYLYNNSDLLVVGKLLGEQALGLYSLVFQVVVLPTDRITSIISQVGFPVYARIQHDTDRFARYFLESLTVTSLLTFPILTGLFVTADLGAVLLLPARWQAVATPLKLMCLVGLVLSVSTLIAPAVLAKGRADLPFRFNLGCLVVMPLGFVAGAQFGLIGVYWAWLLLFPFVAGVWFHLTRSLLGVTWPVLLKALAPATTASTIMLATLLLLRRVAISLPPLWLLFLLVSVGVPTYFAALELLFPGRIGATRDHVRLRSST